MRALLFRSASILTLVAATGEAQSVQTVDAGSFTVLVNGQRAGREDFSITTLPNGAGKDYKAQATVVYGDRRLSPQLRADTAGTPTEYRVESRSPDAQREAWQGTIVRGRVSAKIQSPRGESAKEFIVTDGALILDDDVFHQYYFVAHRTTNGSVAVVIPRRNAQTTLRVTSAGAERVTIGTQELEANHLVLAEPSGATRDVWVDRQSRVLKVAIPSRGIVAVRDDPPR
jgi:hypothetical protein